jgi:hypothetical protein
LADIAIPEPSSFSEVENCPVCGEHFTNVEELIAHAETHFTEDLQAEPERPNFEKDTQKCHLCNKMFVITELVKHVE